MTGKTKVFWGALLVLLLAALASFFLLQSPPPEPEASVEEPDSESSVDRGPASVPSDERKRRGPAPPDIDRSPQAFPQSLPQSLPQTAPPAPPTRLERVDEILDQLEEGHVAFNAPDSINVNDTALIHLVLGVSQEVEQLKEQIEAEGERIGAEVRVANQMEARLTGPNFSITAITPELQAVSASETTEWKCEVQPKEVGSHSLHLTLSAIVSLEGESVRRAIRTFDRVIQVDVTWPQRVSGFFSENWQWLWAAILVPIATWFWRRRKPAKRAD